MAPEDNDEASDVELTDEEYRELLCETNAWLRAQPAPCAPGRNDLCDCGSGRKFKKCCGK